MKNTYLLFMAFVLCSEVGAQEAPLKDSTSPGDFTFSIPTISLPAEERDLLGLTKFEKEKREKALECPLEGPCPKKDKELPFKNAAANCLECEFQKNPCIYPSGKMAPHKSLPSYEDNAPSKKSPPKFVRPESLSQKLFQVRE